MMDFCIQDMAVITCSYAINWFERHEEFQYIIRKKAEI